MVASARRIAFVALASIAVIGSNCRGFTPLSSPVSTKSPPMTTCADTRSCQGTAPSQTPATTKLSFALSNDDGLAPDSQRGTSCERLPSKSKGRARSVHLRDRRRQWVDRSLSYYSTISRENFRRSRGQLPAHHDTLEERRRTYYLAQDHYFALWKIKNGHFDHAETIYRRAINDIKNHEGGCDNAKLAVSTLLLALLLQRKGDIKATRSVFLQFFKVAVLENQDEEKECACSAKVLQAYALFEMRRGYGKKSLEIVEQAVRLDSELKPVLEW
eukprot:CAMPEP_0197438176 /NCGR_PEP_ID=MMETSP1175-20131217/5245_1 /TAXON_ID=1003142 /ORGANISM="Triceratium dubium, Strain CCMP147" /LENGTH=272 /DNA_ID=CAMNT_0042967855 /DNA_START=101 /DNA_END=916 /DNA_ORIENTATION=+